MIGHELLQLRVGPRAHVLQQRWRLDDLVAMHDDAGIEVRRLDCGQAGELFVAGLVHRVLSDASETLDCVTLYPIGATVIKLKN